MKNVHHTSMMIVVAFLLGVGLGGLSLHYASAQGMFGLSTSVSQLGSALVDMQRNVDALQKNMGTVKQVKDQLTSLSPQGIGTLTEGKDKLKQEGDSLKSMFPKF
jgi:ABC-type phosphate transport system auxiliary subunit